MPEPAPEAIDAFIDRWKDSGGHERGAGHQFLLEFCELLTRPFKYSSNLTGKQALSFFGERYPTVYEIRAHRLGDTVVLTARLRGSQKKKTPSVPAALNF